MSWDYVDEHPEYDKVNTALLEIADIDTEMSVIDLACGYGTIMRKLYANGWQGKGWSIDSDPTMVEVAKSKVGDFSEVILSRMENFTQHFHAECSDRVVISNAIHLAENFDDVFLSSKYVLKPGGYLTFSTGFHSDAVHPRDRKFYIEMVFRARKILEDTGDFKNFSFGSKPLAKRIIDTNFFEMTAKKFGFVLSGKTNVTIQFDYVLLKNTVGTEMFATGTFPGIDAKISAKALEMACEQIIELNDTQLPIRDYLILNFEKQ